MSTFCRAPVLSTLSSSSPAPGEALGTRLLFSVGLRSTRNAPVIGPGRYNEKRCVRAPNTLGVTVTPTSTLFQLENVVVEGLHLFSHFLHALFFRCQVLSQKEASLLLQFQAVLQALNYVVKCCRATHRIDRWARFQHRDVTIDRQGLRREGSTKDKKSTQLQSVPGSQIVVKKKVIPTGDCDMCSRDCISAFHLILPRDFNGGRWFDGDSSRKEKKNTVRGTRESDIGSSPIESHLGFSYGIRQESDLIMSMIYFPLCPPLPPPPPPPHPSARPHITQRSAEG